VYMSALDRIYLKNKTEVMNANGSPVLDNNGKPIYSYPHKKNGVQYIPYIRNSQEAKQLSAKYPELVKDENDHGVIFAMYMVLCTYFRIPDYIMDPEQRAKLESPQIRQQLEDLRRKLVDVIQTYKSVNVGS
jgi:hypothetical protein